MCLADNYRYTFLITKRSITLTQHIIIIKTFIFDWESFPIILFSFTLTDLESQYCIMYRQLEYLYSTFDFKVPAATVQGTKH